MKPKVDTAKIEEFWKWFRTVAEPLARDLKNPALLSELDQRVCELHPRVSWEIGPGRSKAWQFVVSPNLDRKLLDTTRLLVSFAPNLADWEFYPTRQVKQWQYVLELETGGRLVPLDASAWTFVLLRHADGAHEVLLEGGNLAELDADARWQAGAIVLESIVGEAVMLDRIAEFSLSDYSSTEYAVNRRPIQQLRDAITGTSQNTDIG